MRTPGYHQRQVYFVGNSMYDKDGTNTFGHQYVPTNTYASIISGKQLSFQCYAVSGIRTTTLLANMPTRVIPYLKANDIVVFTEMTNEIAAGTSVAETYALIIQIRDLVRAVGAKFVLQGAISCNGMTPYNNRTAGLQQVNDYFRITPSLVDGFSDPGALSQCDTDADCANASWFNSDGIHPLDVLYNLIYPLTVSAITPLL